MVLDARPAAYLRAIPGGSARLARQYEGIREGIRQRGWPAPELYVEQLADRSQAGGPALARLQTAIVRGCHHGLLIADPAVYMNPDAGFLGLLFACTRHGVEVGLLLPPALADGLTYQPSGTYEGIWSTGR
jgi:hypothetical protein